MEHAKKSYVPEELNAVFSQAAGHVLAAVKLYVSSSGRTGPQLFDLGMIGEQVNIILEKFAHDLLLVLAETRVKFATLPTIQRNVTIGADAELSFLVSLSIINKVT